MTTPDEPRPHSTEPPPERVKTPREIRLEREENAREFGRTVLLNSRKEGVTFTQALDAAFAGMDPEKAAAITVRLISTLVGEDVSDPPQEGVRQGH